MWQNKDLYSDTNRIIYEDRENNEETVALIIDQGFKKCILGYCQLSEIILTVKLKGKSFNISIIIGYAEKEI